MSTWNLLVVEDEVIVRLGLRQMVDWNRLGIVWRAEASNGEEALQLVDTEHIDIVLTDIRMPGIDGLEFAKRLKTRRPEIQIIFISSFDNFQYAREAIRIGAVDYLHKPTIDETEISGALGKAVAAIEEQRSGQTAITDEERNEWLLSLLDEYTFPNLSQLPKMIAESLPRDFWLTVFRKRDDGAKCGSTDFDELRFFSIYRTIEEIVSKGWGGVVFHRGIREIIWIAPTSPATALTSDRGKYVQDVREKVLELLNTALIFSYTSLCSGVEKLPSAYLEALLQLPAHQQTDNHIVRQAKAYVDRHLLEENLSLGAVAEALQISPAYLSRVFLKEVGENFSDYIIRNKIEYAQNLLRNTNKKIYEISADIGYGNPHYFSKLFKNRVGVSPLDYRNQ